MSEYQYKTKEKHISGFAIRKHCSRSTNPDPFFSLGDLKPGDLGPTISLKGCGT